LTYQKSHSQRALCTQTPALQGPQLLNTDPSSEETCPPTLILTDFATLEPANHFWHAGDLQAMTSKEFHLAATQDDCRKVKTQEDILVPSSHPELFTSALPMAPEEAARLQRTQPLPPPSGIHLSPSRTPPPTLLYSPPPSHSPFGLSSLI
uniref:Psoriasis susceptibility 1 candidate 1 n=1 Tax=Nomascus leucogenys TaxID=61853 RepID=G1R141_NOMLE